MAYVNTTRTTGFGLLHRFQEFRAAAAEKAAKRKVYRDTVQELSNLTNRELADLGIGRSSIKGLATVAAYGDQA